MTSVERHLEVMESKRKGAYAELQAKRLSNFADLIFKAAEQATEALMSRDVVGEKHTRSEIREYLWEKYPELAEEYDALYGIYQELGYPPARDGEMAKKAKEIAEHMIEKCLKEIGT
jgi:hypothetical protein